MNDNFNLKCINWGCRAVNPNGNKLHKYRSVTKYTISTSSKPTYFRFDTNRDCQIYGIRDFSYQINSVQY